MQYIGQGIMTRLKTIKQKYILPIGFSIIIVLMLASTVMSAFRMKTTGDAIINDQSKINQLNTVLDKMSSANLERSHLIFKLIQDEKNINTHVDALYAESISFNNARNEFIALGPSEAEKELLSQQAVLTLENVQSINEVIDAVKNNKTEVATYLVNNKVLPRNKAILRHIESFHKTTSQAAYSNLETAKLMSDDSHKSVIIMKVLSMLMASLLMFVLIKKQRKRDKDLSYLVSTDTLTELPNRHSFIHDIENTVVNANASDNKFALVFLDIDYFKSINDNYGHEMGDKILHRFATTIKNEISSTDMLARFGGDEFVLLLKNINNKKDANRIVKRISNALDTSYFFNDNEIFISASLGASMYPDDGSNAKQLLKNADIAMYAAKEAGRNCYEFYSSKNNKKLEHEDTMAHALQTILKDKNSSNELTLLYQPLINVADKSFHECEALIRWTNKNGLSVNTAEFIEIAEKSNLIEEVNIFVIEQACKQQNEWQKQGLKNIRININLSGNKRIFKQLFKSLTQQVKRYNLDPKLFGIELTERTMYEISAETIGQLVHFRSLGMKIAIDDFGTGYSSLSYLKDLPITTLKIDQKFISGLPSEKVDMALVKTIISLAHSLNLDVIAEGVETQAQFDFLKNSDCNIAQGYLLQEPLKSDEISKLKLVA